MLKMPRIRTYYVLLVKRVPRNYGENTEKQEMSLLFCRLFFYAKKIVHTVICTIPKNDFFFYAVRDVYNNYIIPLLAVKARFILPKFCQDMKKQGSKCWYYYIVSSSLVAPLLIIRNACNMLCNACYKLFLWLRKIK